MSDRTEAAFQEYIGDRLLAPIWAAFKLTNSDDRARKLARDAFMHGASWAVKAATDDALEKAAAVVDASQETISETSEGSMRHVTPRSHGNMMGLAFATAIRALKGTP